ncbi:MAG: DUF1707 domain-containing protein [Gemmatimonadota bacterium]|nr:DUF1707 domain-containing protein [Gemmatimonadota bacterium]
MTDLPVQPIPPSERQKTVDRLCAHFAADHLETDEFERRLDLAYAAQARNELVALEQDLPELRRGAEAEAVDSTLPAPAPSASVDTSRPVQERDFMAAVMGGTERGGNWIPAKHTTVLTLMGSASLDFREATYTSQEISVTLFSIMGGAEIIVPPGVHVESNGIAIMGGWGKPVDRTPADPNAPVIRINGLVLMGGVDIKERQRGETERDARKRLKAEKKAARRGSLPPGSDT